MHTFGIGISTTLLCCQSLLWFSFAYLCVLIRLRCRRKLAIIRGHPVGEAANWFASETSRVCRKDQAALLFLFRHRPDGIEGGIVAMHSLCV